MPASVWRRSIARLAVRAGPVVWVRSGCGGGLPRQIVSVRRSGLVGRVSGWWEGMHPCRFPILGNLGHTRCPRGCFEVRAVEASQVLRKRNLQRCIPTHRVRMRRADPTAEPASDGQANRPERRCEAPRLPRRPARAGVLRAHRRAAPGRRAPRPNGNPGRGSDDRRGRAIRPGVSAFREYSIRRARIFDGWSCRLQAEATGAHDLVG